MSLLRFLPAIVVLVPALAQKQEVRELQRDVAVLQDQVRSLERSFNEKVGSITTLLQQAIDSVNKLNTNMAVLDSALRDREKNMTGPVASVGAKVDQMANEFQFLRTTIEDMNGRMGKLERQLVDMNNTIKVMQAPPVAPPPSGPGITPGGMAGAPPAGVSAESLYANSLRDKESGNYDMALEGFNNYLKFFGNTDTAPNAQYYIGEIHFLRKQYDNALDAFEAVERYPDNAKTLDALFMKGRTLVAMQQRTAGADQFQEVIARAPRSALAQRSREEIKKLGLSPRRPSPTKRK
jgi:TolA-binding protein